MPNPGGRSREVGQCLQSSMAAAVAVAEAGEIGVAVEVVAALVAGVVRILGRALGAEAEVAGIGVRRGEFRSMTNDEWR